MIATDRDEQAKNKNKKNIIEWIKIQNLNRQTSQNIGIKFDTLFYWQINIDDNYVRREDAGVLLQDDPKRKEKKLPWPF